MPVLLFQLEQKQVVPPFKPNISGEFGLDNFDAQFTNEPIQLTPDDEWVPISPAPSFIQLWFNITFVIYTSLFPSQWRCQEDRPVWVWRLRVHQSTPDVGGGVRVRDVTSWPIHTTHSHPAPPRTHNTHTLMHVFHGVSVSSSCMVTRQPDDVNLVFEGRTCTVERLFAKTSLTLCHL